MTSEKSTDSIKDQLRYARQIMLPEVGPSGQRRLQNARVLMVGLGGLGCPAALYLAGAGVGHIALLDDDLVSLSNLQRQVLYSESDLGQPKVTVAKRKLLALNSGLTIDAWEERLTLENAEARVAGYELVIDATDNFAARIVLNAACQRLKKPLVYGAMFRFDAQLSLFPPGGPCYQCLYPHLYTQMQGEPASAQNCEQAGVLGAMAGMVGSIQALEALKWIINGDQRSHDSESLAGRLLVIDSRKLTFDTLRISKRVDCPSCSASSLSAGLPPWVQREIAPVDQISSSELESRRGKLTLIDIRDEPLYRESHIPGAQHLAISGALNQTVAQLERDWGLNEELVIYCHSGSKSRFFVSELRDRGFTKVRHLAGGFVNWLRSSGR